MRIEKRKSSASAVVMGTGTWGDNWVSNVNPETGGYGRPNPGAQVTHTDGFTLKGKSDMDYEMTYKLVE